MPRVKFDSVEISYYDSGDGVPVVFLHSFGHDKMMWLPQLSYFSDRGYRVVAPDFRGHGGSSFDPNDHTVKSMARDTLLLLRRLNIEDVVVVGISMGGYVAMEMWAMEQNVIRGLVLSNTKAEADTAEVKNRRMNQIELIRAKGVEEFVNTGASRRLSKKTVEKRPWVLDFIKLMNLRINAQVLTSTLTAMINKPNRTDLLKGITVPTLILAGSEDNFIQTSSAQLMRERIKDSKLGILENTGHVSNLEDPVVYNEQVAAFLKSVV